MRCSSNAPGGFKIFSTPKAFVGICCDRPPPSVVGTPTDSESSFRPPESGTCWRGDASSCLAEDSEDGREAGRGTGPLCDIETWSPTYGRSGGPAH